jgi:serine protease Do
MPIKHNDPCGVRLATRLWLSRLGLGAATGLGFAIALGAVPAAPVLLPVATAHAQTAPITSLPSFADLVDKVRPAVVSINTKNDAGQEQGQGLGQEPFDQPTPEGPPRDWHDFMDRFRKKPSAPKEPQIVRAQGSGFVISSDGYIVTNHHVVDKAQEITVIFENDQKLEAEVVGSDPRTDVALLKIKGDKKIDVHLDFAKGRPCVGDWVLAVGNPFGLGGTVTAGIISARNRDIQNGTPYDFLQIDAAVNRGNSGGPAINLNGEVVGMNTAIYSPSGGNVGIAFSIPSDLLQSIVEQLKSNHKVSRGWLGVGIQAVTEDLASALGLPEAHGAMIAKVFPDGPSAKSDLKNGDVVLEVNGEQIKDSRELARKIADLKPQSEVKLTVFREGAQKITVLVKLGDFPPPDRLANLETDKPQQTTPEASELGLTLAPAQEAPGGSGSGSEEGLVVLNVDQSSDAAEKGLRPRDVIVDVEKTPVSSTAEFAKIVREAREKHKKAILLKVRTGGQTRYVGLSLSSKEKGKKDASKGDLDKDGGDKKPN